MRAPFDVYHTDEDTPDAVDVDNFEKMVDLIGRAINVFEQNSVLKRKFSGLPCLSSPDLDLYLSPTVMSHVRQDIKGGGLDTLLPELAQVATRRSENLNYMMNVLPVMCEGGHTVLDVAEKVELPFELVDTYTELWVEKELLEKAWTNPFGEST